MLRAILLFLLLPASLPAYGATPEPASQTPADSALQETLPPPLDTLPPSPGLWSGARVKAATQFIDDSDDANQRISTLSMENPLPRLGQGSQVTFGLGSRLLRSPQGQESFESARVEMNWAALPTTAFKAQLTPLHSSDWSPWLGAVSATHKPSPRWYLELSAERELVDTVIAVRARNLIDSLGGSADYQLTPDWAVVAGMNTQDFSDGNNRLGRIFRLVYAPAGRDWNTQLRLKRLDSDFNGAGYFSPPRLEEAIALAKISWPVFNGNSLISVQAGAGQQRINGVDRNSLYAAEFRARGWFTQRFGFEGHLSCSNAGGLSSRSASGYRYCEIMLALISAL